MIICIMLQSLVNNSVSKKDHLKKNDKNKMDVNDRCSFLNVRMKIRKTVTLDLKPSYSKMTNIKSNWRGSKIQ